MTRLVKPPDPDRRTLRTPVVSIGIAVAATAAVLVIVTLGLTALNLWWQTQPAELNEPPNAGETLLYINTSELLIALAVIGAAAVAIAGIATIAIARRAVRPLSDTFRRQRRFVADASHELRTPLTVLHARIQLLQRRLGADADTAPIVRELGDDAQALIDIVNDLLDASTDTGAPPTTDQTDADQVIAAAVHTMRVLADERGVTIRIRTHASAAVLMPAVRLRRCVLALLDNAVEHSPAGTTITVTAGAVGHFVSIDVSDEGTGIRGADAEHIFERFTHSRTDLTVPGTAQTTGTRRTGYGIGLFLVRENVTRYGGSVDVMPTTGTGTTIRLLIPRATRVGTWWRGLALRERKRRD